MDAIPVVGERGIQMEAIYFFAGISLLVAGNYFVVYRINKQRYLHTPFRLTRANRSRNKSVQPEPEPEQTHSQSKMHAYVDWYTQRSPASRKQDDSEESAVEENVHLSGSRPGQDALVGMAVLEQSTTTPEQPRGNKNIDRWYRNTVNA